MPHTHLAIDLGAESGRAMVGVLDDGGLRLQEVHRFTHLPRHLPSGLHWDVVGLFGAVVEGLRRGVAWAESEGLVLETVGVDTWGVDYGLLSSSGALLGLPHCYRDTRNDAAFEAVISRLGATRLYEATGIQLMALNTLFQLVAARDADPEMIAQAGSLLFMPDLMHYFLTGTRTVEASIASTSQMIDPRTGAWATTVLEMLDLPTGLLRPPVSEGTTVGALLAHIAAEVGAPSGLRIVTPAGHDTACAVAAVPAVDGERWCYLSSGTWSLLGAERREPCLTPAAQAAPFTNEGGIGGSIRFLQNIAGLWIVQECRRDLEARGDTLDYERLTMLARMAPAFRTLIDPGHRPFAAPGRMPEKIAAYARATGQPEPSGAGPLVRCGLESLALAYRRPLEQLESVLDERFDVIHVVGGGGRNRLLDQMTADATGRRVVVGPYEATAAGNVLIQAMGVGALAGPDAIRRVVASSFDLETFQPRGAGAWDEAYERYRSLLASPPSTEPA